jgi:hypothetical protein
MGKAASLKQVGLPRGRRPASEAPPADDFVAISVRIPHSLYEALKSHNARHRMSTQALCTKLLRDHLGDVGQ